MITLFLLAMTVSEAHAASGMTKGDARFAVEDAAVKTTPEDDLPSFGLPPIAVRVLEDRTLMDRSVVFKADLVFDEVDEERIKDTMRVTKALLPRIMDSVITGIHGKRFSDLTTLAALNHVVLQRSNAVLRPYGVVVKSLRMMDLRNPRLSQP